jgi:hypothetical protein
MLSYKTIAAILFSNQISIDVIFFMWLRDKKDRCAIPHDFVSNEPSAKHLGMQQDHGNSASVFGM